MALGIGLPAKSRHAQRHPRMRFGDAGDPPHLAGAWDAETLPEVPHAFSQYRLRLQPRRLREVAPRAAVGDNPDLRWVARDELHAFALPAPIRKLIDSRT